MKGWHRLAALFIGLTAASIPVRATAELYSYTDKDGVIHFTNIPANDPRYRPHEIDGRKNTFRWNDELGTLRKVHRVDVGTYDKIIVEAARYYSLPPSLLKAIIAVESSFEPSAVSPAHARGLMQLIDRTARSMGVKDVFDPKQNVFGGSRYLRMLANAFGGDIRKTIAAYNAGPRAVQKHGGVPHFEETQKYVRRVLKLYHHYLKTGIESSN